MATITLTNATRQTMATTFVNIMNAGNLFAFGMRATTARQSYRDQQEFKAALSFKAGNEAFNDDKFGKTKVVWQTVGANNNRAVIENALGNDTELPLLVIYEDYAREGRYFRDMAFVKKIGEPDEYSRVLMSYQILPSELQLVELDDYGVTYVQSFEVTF